MRRTTMHATATAAALAGAVTLPAAAAGARTAFSQTVRLMTDWVFNGALCQTAILVDAVLAGTPLPISTGLPAAPQR
jgi:hypothetical protein